MPAAALAAIAALEMVLLRKYDVTLGAVIKILGIEILVEHKSGKSRIILLS
ncbi:MAG: hypothetical protein K0S32_1722 [Bacteroidetes bacterium]|jgi:hypothetical protein|nr:hypothetical protein [Bacteroidota bacterium]